MPLKRYSQLVDLLRSDPPGGSFFFSGDEDFLREETIDRVVTAHLDEATRDFNFDQLRGGELSADGLASLIATPPMMAARRVVVVRDAQGLHPTARAVVESFLKDPPADVVLILSATIPSGTRSKFYTLLRELTVTVEFAALDPLDAPGWIVERARLEYALELDPEAARGLVAALGPALGPLAAELAKLAAYVGERKRVTAADVRAVTGAVTRFDRWAWFDLVGERKWAEARRGIPSLLDGGETAVGLVIGMSSQLLRVGLACAGGVTALERELKPYQRWLARRIAPQARGWSLGEVDAALAELLRADRLLKSASLSDQQVLEELLLRLAAIRPPAAAAA